LKKIQTKEAAEAALNELPSVIGAFVREDVYGHPREVHLLVGPGPDVRHFARDVRGFLEERLGVPVDQRVISIAQIADPADRQPATQNPEAEAAAPPAAPVPEPLGRPVFRGVECLVSQGRVEVCVFLEQEGAQHEARVLELESSTGRARAAAAATLKALSGAAIGKIRLELESASVIRALDRDFALVALLAAAPALGRSPLHLVGAHPLGVDDVATAGALATLKALNRVLTLAARPSDVRRGRSGGVQRTR
jgi:hypothetical protein